MKTLTRTIIVLVALSVLMTTFARAQTNQPAKTSPTPSKPMPAPAPTPVPTTTPTIPGSAAVDLVSNNMFGGFSLGSRSGGAGTVLVIPSEQTTTEDLLTINEDMNVMSRIFEKNLEQDRIKTVTSSIFISRRRDIMMPLLGGGRSETQSMYLQGFGALFMLKVDFPLSPPPDVQEEEKEIKKTEQGDAVWDQMRQQIYEPEKIDRRGRTDRPESKYDAEKVKNLKTTLIKALKHAANIRCLKPDESVILTVVGKGDVTGKTISAARVLPGENQIVIVEKDEYGSKTQKVVQGNSLDDIGLSSPTVLVIRSNKSDIDEFAKGSLDNNQFRQRVQLLTYPLLGGADGNPFDAYYGSRSRSARGSYGSRSTGSSSSR